MNSGYKDSSVVFMDNINVFMKFKTEKKLIKRELLKPLHHIDTSIIIESAKNTKLGNICKKYLNLIGYKYRGCFSLPVVGEYFMKVIIDIKEFMK